MSVRPLQAVVMNGQHLVISSLPLPCRPLWLLVLNVGTLTRCLMEVALRQKAGFIESKCYSFAEDPSSNHCWGPLRSLFTAGGWSELPMVTQQVKGQAGHSIIKPSGRETSFPAICHAPSVFLRWQSGIIHPKRFLGKQGVWGIKLWEDRWTSAKETASRFDSSFSRWRRKPS